MVIHSRRMGNVLTAIKMDGMTVYQEDSTYSCIYIYIILYPTPHTFSTRGTGVYNSIIIWHLRDGIMAHNLAPGYYWH